jgi:membrane-associated phospholipid phosphatase
VACFLLISIKIKGYYFFRPFMKGWIMEQINAIEIVVNQFFQSLGLWLKLPMQAITALGYEEFFVLLLPTLYWCFDQMVGLRLGMVLLIGNTTNTFFKFLFHNSRPYWFSDSVESYTHETSFGIPSGHAQIAASVWGWLAFEVKKKWFTTAAILLIFLIGISRLYLGVHFLSDVLLGWLLGGLLVWAFAAWHKPVGKWLSQRSLTMKLVLVLLSTVVIIGLIMGVWWNFRSWEMPSEWAMRAGEVDPFSLEGIFTLAGTWMGMLGGYVLLTASKGHFLAGQGGWRRIVRFLVGLVGIVVFYFGLGQIFPDNADFLSYALRLIRYTLIGLWVSWFGPVVFERLRLLKFEDNKSK